METYNKETAENRLKIGNDFLKKNPNYSETGKNYGAYFARLYQLHKDNHKMNHDKALEASWKLTETMVDFKKVSAFGKETGFGGGKVNDSNWDTFVEDFKEFCEKHKDSIKAMKENCGRVPAVYPKIVDKKKAKEFDAKEKGQTE